MNGHRQQRQQAAVRVADALLGDHDASALLNNGDKELGKIHKGGRREGVRREGSQNPLSEG